ncbi:type II toxin-antitoxin system RelE/ParE family toxin [Sulfurimonas sp.]|uniref:type II toxin-antitoxin system RelE/ParE family toxin n=1 Tax=Sulfurimonas sp. TaxID=2022749 RepID=UPI001A071A82|nr:type II toxin-antitoxin system RelE/ParE family toxin [Sulfurimonas sp.]MBE0515606.1 type II toxin-antitoxin system RelE/ParE family toxin [Sulfurimonas sp.]
MNIRFEESFINSLALKLEYIAKDNPRAARKFKNELFASCKDISDMPYKYRKSIYHDDEKIRDLVFKGYTVVYMIEDETISIFTLIHHEKYSYTQVEKI